MGSPLSSLITTQRLCLRPFSVEDDDRGIELLTNAEIAKTFMVPAFTSREEAAALFARMRGQSLSADHFVRGIYLAGELIGFLNDVDTFGTEIEVGYVIHPAHQNNGYATEALSAAVATLFAGGFTTVRAGAFAENTASMRVMEKCGMRRTGDEFSMNYRGSLHRCLYYEIRRPSHR